MMSTPRWQTKIFLSRVSTWKQHKSTRRRTCMYRLKSLIATKVVQSSTPYLSRALSLHGPATIGLISQTVRRTGLAGVDENDAVSMGVSPDCHVRA
ncbi:hypothetical protein BAUCODRAFT_32631 [Baudoinia panamericana UAMH 10762]|uniref:Uncharacterized protein n=1 Tax=Baudoinia panamericana (strain UAMH 10762) TaxID=717646 RepID=M2MJL4_BAUPA|nr:uncharacterized protein BAUCODRAFT_32631 [Baudoinia panamericana UAMH 10762]EMC96886.1 hypothetical protein BAUCODRAFT_32631 [Baudoinia panamericana UAMH 10762]